MSLSPSSSSSSPTSSSSSSEDEEPPTQKRSLSTKTEDSTISKKSKTTSSTTPAVPPPLEIAPAASSADGKNNAIKNQRKIIVLLDQARLETVKTRKGHFELLNCDDHRDLCKKHRRDPKENRPDICHQELLALIDSPLNKAGYLQVYIRTHKGVLIEIHPSIRIPRTFKRFSGLIVQLLHKMKIKAGTTSQTLMKVIKNPFSQHLPPGTCAYGMSSQGQLYNPMALATAICPDSPNSTLKNGGPSPPICFVIGAMASGSIKEEDHPYIQKMISVSEYPLSGAAAISRILSGIEHHWGIV